MSHHPNPFFQGMSPIDQNSQGMSPIDQNSRGMSMPNSEYDDRMDTQERRARKKNVNVCNDYNITSISTRSNHAYVNVSNASPYIDFFKNFIELLNNKNYVSNISSLINIEETKDTDDISCIQKNKGNKRLIDIYINMALKAVVKLLTAYKNYYDSTILIILKDTRDSRGKLIKHINNIEDQMQKSDKDNVNNAIKLELHVLKNLLCSIDADKDYKRYLDLSIKAYDEYLKIFTDYENTISQILTMKSISDINRHLVRSIHHFGKLLVHYNMYVVYALKAYASYTRMNTLGIEKYSNIDHRIVNIYHFKNTDNVNKVNFLDKVFVNYYLVLPNNIEINSEFVQKIYSEIDDDRIESYMMELMKQYTKKPIFKDSYIHNILKSVLESYFEQAYEIVNRPTYVRELGSLRESYNNFLHIILNNQVLREIYTAYKSDFTKKYKKKYKIDETVREFLSTMESAQNLPASEQKRKSRGYAKSLGGTPINYKQSILDNLRILADYEKLNKEPFKMRAYNKVIESIELSDEAICNLEDIKKIKGVGDKITLKTKELIETGKITAVENALKDPRFSLQKQLGKLYGVGPVKINELMSKISSFDELYENPDLLNDKQKIGLKYYKDMELRIPISEGKKHYKIIDKIFKLTNDKIEFELVGSYRRMNKDMGDIDILIKNSDGLNLKKLIANLVESGYIIETLASGKSKFMGLCKLSPDLPARRLDILIAEPSYYYFALLYFTGSYSFNIYMRKIALEKGYSLSEYGLKGKDNKIIDTSDTIKSEEDIFKFLHIPYVSPEKRNIVS